MTAKEYLSQVWRLTMQIKSDKRRLTELNDMLETWGVSAIDYSKDRVQSSVNGSGIEDMVIRYVDQVAALDEKIMAEQIELVKVKYDIATQIKDYCSKSGYAEFLMWRYVEGKNIAEISNIMYISYDRARHLHRESLTDFEKNYLAKL